jgi:hypothetical protein
MLFAASRQLTYLLLLVASSSAISQDLKIPDTPENLHLAPPPSDRFPAKWYPRVGDGTDVAPAPVTDRPYTATYGKIAPLTTETPDNRATEFQARDRFGRTRNDGENGGMTIGEQRVKTKSVSVSDPVSHCQFDWTQPTIDVEMPSTNRVAYVTCRPQAVRYKELDLFKVVMDGVPEGTTTHGNTTTTIEHLTPMKVDGLTILRLRVTNSQIDERGQMTKWSTETWYSPELEEVVRRGSDEEGFVGLTNIERKDPDPKLFYPPDGYRIELRPPP